jgi:hypothetical protein
MALARALVLDRHGAANDDVAAEDEVADDDQPLACLQRRRSVREAKLEDG